MESDVNEIRVHKRLKNVFVASVKKSLFLNPWSCVKKVPERGVVFGKIVLWKTALLK